MSDPFPSVASPVAFGRFVLDLARRRLLRNGKPVALSAKALELLAILITQSGEIVSRQQLYDILWPGGLVEDGNLTQHVYVLRRIMDPTGDGRRFIQTAPRRGYCFVHPLKRVELGRHPRRAFVQAGLAAAVALSLLVSGSAVRSTDAPLSAGARVAYDLGVYHWNMRTPAELKSSVQYFEQTVRLAPQSALGYAGLALAYAMQADSSRDHSYVSRRKLELAKRYRDQALARDPLDAQAHTVTAFLAYRYARDLVAAEREFSVALRVQPDYATAHHWHAIMRFAQGRIAEATREWELAHELEPTSEVISRWLGRAYLYERRPDDAIRLLRETLAIQPGDNEAWFELASAQDLRGDYRQALHSLESIRTQAPDEADEVRMLEARVKADAGHGAVDRWTLAQVRRASHSKKGSGLALARFLVALGRRGEAIAALKASRPESILDVSMTRNDPLLDALRSDPRFQKLFG